MTVYIPIRKIREDDESVEYRFGDNKGRWGRLRLDKCSGEVVVVEAAAGDEKGFLSSRASRKVVLHWKEGKFPDETCWAS